MFPRPAWLGVTSPAPVLLICFYPSVKASWRASSRRSSILLSALGSLLIWGLSQQPCSLEAQPAFRPPSPQQGNLHHPQTETLLKAVVLTLREKKAPASLFPIFVVFVQADANTWVHFSFCNEHTANEKKKRSLDDFSGREKENCLQVSEGLLCSQQRSGIFLVSISEHRVRGRQ